MYVEMIPEEQKGVEECQVGYEGGTSSDTSAATVTQQSPPRESRERDRGSRKEKARPTPSLGERTREQVEEAVRYGVEPEEQRLGNLVERAQEELRSAVEAGLTVVQAGGGGGAGDRKEDKVEEDRESGSNGSE